MDKEYNGAASVLLPLLALRGVAIFPGTILNFEVGRKKSVVALNEAMKRDRRIFLVAQRDIRDEEPTQANLYSMGTVAEIKQILHMPGENLKVLVEGDCRAKIHRITQTDPFFEAEVEPCAVPVKKSRSDVVEALIRQTQSMMGDYVQVGPNLAQEVISEIMMAKDPGKLADFVASNIFIKLEDKQAVLREREPVRRLRLVVEILGRETDILRLEQEISQKVQKEVNKGQREYFLREQMKVIANELGEEDSPADEAEDYHRAIDKLNLSGEAAKKLHAEADRLAKMPQGSHEGTVVRSWLDTCLSLPWNKETRDKTDLAYAAKVLDSDHYGLKKVKERILESIAVKQLAPDSKGQIICLVGPPGVGKTSIAHSIARAMGRKYVRVSLGGVRDEADIRGHRKTYIGAMPGRIINAIALAGTRNPLLLLDEIDKLFDDYMGDPSAALLEVLDSEQNFAFRDHYIEIPFDLSDVAFVTTANTIDTIPAPLLDRMDVIEISSYTREEKFQIAKRHLVKKQLKRHGLTRRNLHIKDKALYDLADYYTREAGVRSLERQIASICRKAAKKIAAGEETSITVGGENLEKILGPHRFISERISAKDEVGVVTGLAWTTVGGETMPIEACVLDGSGKLELTGSLGDVMKESAKAAVSYIRSRADELNIQGDFYKTKDIHIHVPEGAVPKDGPSAGVTIATSLVSALLGRPVRRDVAMTGEITLRGRILPIGGLREKTMAAYRAGIKTIVIPKDNLADLEEVEQVVRDNVRFVTADNMDTVLETAIIFPESDDAPAQEKQTEKLAAVSAPILPPAPDERPVIRQ